MSTRDVLTADPAIGATALQLRRGRGAPCLNQETENALQRFPVSIRRKVRRLARSSPQMADLATVFPGLLYALAAARGETKKRQRAKSLIESGAVLKSVARAMELPMWLRRLPPEAFEDLPDNLPSSESFGRRITCRMPRQADESPHWFASVLFAEKACHEDFAIWLAEQNIFAEEGEVDKLFAVLAAYAWFSRERYAEAHSLIVVPWRPEVSFETALCAAKSWFNRLRLVLQMPNGAVTDSWLIGGTAHGYAFEPLLDHPSILAEAQAMQNCADQYGERIVRERCRLFSVKRNGIRVATMEIGPHPREAGVLTITQLKARFNMAASSDVWQAAHAWMSQQRGLKRTPPLSAGARDFDQEAWGRLMGPYRDDKGGAPWFDREATHLMFACFDAELANLARLSGVMSWLFT